MKTIEILASSCARCRELEHRVRRAVERLGISCRIEKVTDLDRFLALGVFAIPSLVIAGEVKVVGRLPKEAELESLIREAFASA